MTFAVINNSISFCSVFRNMGGGTKQLQHQINIHLLTKHQSPVTDTRFCANEALFSGDNYISGYVCKGIIVDSCALCLLMKLTM